MLCCSENKRKFLNSFKFFSENKMLLHLSPLKHDVGESFDFYSTHYEDQRLLNEEINVFDAFLRSIQHSCSVMRRDQTTRWRRVGNMLRRRMRKGTSSKWVIIMYLMEIWWFEGVVEATRNPMFWYHLEGGSRLSILLSMYILLNFWSRMICFS